jgi:hypothetical protein
MSVGISRGQDFPDRSTDAIRGQFNPTDHDCMKKFTVTIPRLGSRVRGLHILGAAYEGTLTTVRGHTINPDLFEFTITFDAPIDLGSRPKNRGKDIRAAIITTCDLRSMFEGDTRWKDGHGGYFEIISAA